MNIKFSPEISAIAGYAREEAMRTGSYGIGTDHLVLGVLRHGDNAACRILEGLGIAGDELKEHIDSRIMKDAAVPYDDFNKIRLTRSAQSVLNMAAFEALKRGSKEIAPEHMLLAVVRSECSATDYLNLHGVNAENVCDYIRDNFRKTEEELPEEPGMPVKDIAGALGEQLGNVIDSVNRKSNIFS